MISIRRENRLIINSLIIIFFVAKDADFRQEALPKNLSKRIEEFEDADVVLIDWPIYSIAKKIRAPVILIDRGPPADKGILAKLQWRPWIKSWGEVS